MFMKITFQLYSGFLLLSLAFCNINTLQAQPFTEITNHGLPAVMDGVVKWADFDNDGDLDVLMTGDGNFFSPYPMSMTRSYTPIVL